MKLPFAELAVIEPDKLADYLLNVEHRWGRSKAVFFLGLGFRTDQLDEFAQALLRTARATEMEETKLPFGIKYEGLGTLHAPNGRRVQIRTVWMLREGVPPPYLVTAYPDRRSR